MPRKQLEYRGVTVEEMDLDAILARKPVIAVVDELAHTNAPGSRNRKRYQDVLELLDAGINVIGAFNVQHLESLNDVVSRNAGVTVRETIPDSFVKQAEQVVNLDLAVEDLLERLKAGKIYPPDKVPWALEHFFQDANLSALRELSLREVAESLDRTAQAREQLGQPRRSSTGERVMVCLSSYPPHAMTLLRRGSRMAGRLSTDWFVVYVETPTRVARAHRRRACSATCTPTSKRRASWAPRWCACRVAIRWSACSISRARTAWGTSSSAARTSRGGGRCSGARCRCVWCVRRAASIYTSSRSTSRSRRKNQLS